MATLNIGMKVNRAITGATTVNLNSYAMVTYSAGAHGVSNPQSSQIDATPQGQVITRTFGPSQSIPSSFTTPFDYYSSPSGTKVTSSITWTLLSGVEISNTQ